MFFVLIAIVIKNYEVAIMKNEGVVKAIALLGNQALLAKKCEKSQSTISDWLNGRKKIKPEHVVILMAVTDGKIPAYEFRPDLPLLFPHPPEV